MGGFLEVLNRDSWRLFGSLPSRDELAAPRSARPPGNAWTWTRSRCLPPQIPIIGPCRLPFHPSPSHSEIGSCGEIFLLSPASARSEASDGEAARRQVVDLVTAYNFAAQSIGILSLLVEVLSRTFLPTIFKNLKAKTICPKLTRIIHHVTHEFIIRLEARKAMTCLSRERRNYLFGWKWVGVRDG